METNSPHAWFLAARPKTLTGAAVPVMIGIALAFHDAGTEDFRIIPAILCMLFAFVMQIDANFINDYFDFKRGNDDETRLGPKRACSEGWISPSAMLKGIIATTLFGCAIGLPLIYYGGLEMIMVGLVCVIFCFLYTTLFSYLGLGDVLVLIFFGIIPVCVTQYLCAAPTAGVGMQGINIEGLLIALACGIVIDTLLIVNNYRDIDNDRCAGKKTLIVRIGKENGLRLYLVAGIVGAAIVAISLLMMFPLWLSLISIVLLLPYLLLHISTYKDMAIIGEGRELNKTLGKTARNMFVFGLSTAIAIVLCATLI